MATHTVTLTARQILDFAELVRHLTDGHAPNPLPQADSDALYAFLNLLPETSDEEGDEWLKAQPTFAELKPGQRVRFGGEIWEVEQVRPAGPWSESVSIDMVGGTTCHVKGTGRASLVPEDLGFCQYPTKLNRYGMPAETCYAPAVEYRPDRLIVRRVCADHARD